MPFAYYGAKHGLAPKYPLPRHRVIVEPFAGSAAYAVRHAYRIDHAILIDADERLVDLWHEVQQMTVADLDRIERQLDGERFNHPLLAGIAGRESMIAALDGKVRAVTPRMRVKWPHVRGRIEAALPRLRGWEIVHGDYRDAPDIEATWFVDPPYQAHGSLAGEGYRHGSAPIDFAQLGDWCRARRGLVLVCEQSPADWLPFHPFAVQKNGGHSHDLRHELIWRSDLEQPTLWAAT